MKYSTFKNTLKEFKDTNKDISELYNIGVNLLDGKYSISDSYYKIFRLFMESFYDRDGFEWIEWFIFESKYGTDKEITANDNGEPICYSTKSLWEYLEKNHKLSDEN